MIKSRFMAFSGIITTILSWQSFASESLCDADSGMIQSNFVKQMKTVGLEPVQYFMDYPADHILNLNKTLQTNGCFQKDGEFYRNGGESNFKINVEQAKEFLSSYFILFKSTITTPQFLPHEISNDTDVDVVMNGDTVATLYKHFNSLRFGIERGYKFRKIHFSFQQQKANTLELFIQEYPEFAYILEAYPFQKYMTELNLNINEDNFKKMNNNEDFAENYVIATNPTWAKNMGERTTKIITNKKYLGVLSVSVESWQKEMELFEYPKSFNGDYDKATVAWAKAEWNAIARQLNDHTKTYIKKNALSESYIK